MKFEYGMINIELSWQRCLVSLLVVLVGYILFQWKKNCDYFGKFGIPGPTPLPLVGNMGLFLKPTVMVETFEQLCKQYGKFFGVHMLGRPVLVINDVDIAKEVLTKQFHKFHGRLGSNRKLPAPYNSMMTGLDGQEWKDLRSIISPLFSSGKLRMMSQIFDTASLTLLGKLQVASDEETTINIMQYFRCYTMEAITAAAFGLQSHCQTDPNDEIMLAAKNALKPSRKNFVLTMAAYCLGEKLSSKLLADLTHSRFGVLEKMSRKIIEQRRQQEDYAFKDMLQLMLDAQHPDKPGHKLSDNEVLAQSMLFLLAGYETSSTALTSSCYFLAKHQDVQEKLHDLLKESSASSSDIAPHEVPDLPYLDAVIYESLRFASPGSFLGRLAKEDVEINGLIIKKNTGIMFPVFYIHRDAEHWQDADEFKPERFLPENKASINPYAYFGFGQGPRNCVGMRFALAKVRHALARVVMSYRIETCSETSPTLESELREMASDKAGALFRVFKRSN